MLKIFKVCWVFFVLFVSLEHYTITPFCKLEDRFHLSVNFLSKLKPIESNRIYVFLQLKLHLNAGALTWKCPWTLFCNLMQFEGPFLCSFSFSEPKKQPALLEMRWCMSQCVVAVCVKCVSLTVDLSPVPHWSQALKGKAPITLRSPQIANPPWKNLDYHKTETSLWTCLVHVSLFLSLCVRVCVCV